VDDHGMCRIRVTDCSYSRVLSKMPRKPEQFCSAEDTKVMALVEWILHQDFTVRVHTTDIVSAVKDALRSL